MKANKRTFLLISVWLIFLVLPLCYFLAHDVNLFSDDANRYASHIKSECVSDWHSTLFIYEGIFIRRILCLLLSDVKGTLVLRLWWLASWGAMMLCAFIWLRKAISVDRKYFFQPLFLFPCLILLYLHGYLYFRYYLDLYFFAVVLVTLTAVPFLRDRRGWVRNTALILILAGLIHLPAFRRNSVLILPIIAFFAIGQLWLHMKTWKKVCASVIFSATLYLLSSAAITLLLPVHKHQYPTTPMMVSDLKIAAILDGTLEKETEQLKTFHLEIYDRREHYGRDARHVLGPENFTVDICPPDDEEWKAFVQHYLQAWKEHPKSMFFSRLIQGVQFYNQDKVPVLIQKAAELEFPHIAEEEMTWKYKNWGAVAQPRWGFIRWVTYTVVLLSLCLSLCLRKKMKEDSYMKFMTYGALVALVYAASFLVVTPTPDNRYHSLSLYLSFWYLTAFVLFPAKQKVRTRGGGSCQKELTNESGKG